MVGPSVPGVTAGAIPGQSRPMAGIRFAGAVRRAAVLVLALVAAACATGPEDMPGVTRYAAGMAVPFPEQLQRLGVDYAPPATGKAILVNIPAFELIAFEDGEPVLRSRVIVGTPWHPTPILDTHVSRVTFRPTWRPTPAMVASGEYVDRVWPPGTRNPLGLAAVRLEPGLLVYLHDTNQRQLFEREMRALSHGCVRVQKWDEVVAFVLGMDLEEVRRLAGGRRTLEVPAEPIQVTLGYYTVFPDETGELRRFEDIYRRAAGTAEVSRAAGCIGAPAK
jgi:murein L,D-transpeptidase YcbB/YkuD